MLTDNGPTDDDLAAHTDDRDPTVHPIDTEALREQYGHLVEKYGPEAWAESRAHFVLTVLDALAAAEHRATRAEAQIKAVERLTYASDDGTEYEHNGHGPAEGEPECPGCWALDIRRALTA